MKIANSKAKLGVALLLTVFSLNAIHAFNDYGIKENKLNYEVMAQSSTTGGGSTGGVDCCCAVSIIGWGKGCKADNWGATCAQGAQTCWSYNNNCSN